jgi:NitT/TauT family transport system substrate-binding protein
VEGPIARRQVVMGAWSRGRGRACAVVLALVLSVACGTDPEPPMRIGTVPWPTGDLFFLAQSRGWLNPSDFRLVEFVDDGEAMRAFRNRAVAAAWLTLDELMAVEQMASVDAVILLLTDESRGGDAVVAHPDVITPADLKDRRVAAQINSVNAYLLDRTLRQAGLSVSDVRLVNLPPYRQLRAFRARDVDAVATYEPIRSQILAEGGVEIFSSASTPFELLRVLAIQRDYLETHAGHIETLCTAWQSALTHVRTTEAGRAWIGERLGATPEGVDQMLAGIRLIDLAENRIWLAPARPRLLPTLARLQSDLLERGLLVGPVEISPFLSWPAALNPSVCRG